MHGLGSDRLAQFSVEEIVHLKRNVRRLVEKIASLDFDLKLRASRPEGYVTRLEQANSPGGGGHYCDAEQQQPPIRLHEIFHDRDWVEKLLEDCRHANDRERSRGGEHDEFVQRFRAPPYLHSGEISFRFVRFAQSRFLQALLRVPDGRVSDRRRYPPSSSRSRASPAAVNRQRLPNGMDSPLLQSVDAVDLAHRGE